MSTLEDIREDAKRERIEDARRNWSCGHSGNCPCAQPDSCELCEGSGYVTVITDLGLVDSVRCRDCDGAGWQS